MSGWLGWPATIISIELMSEVVWKQANHSNRGASLVARALGYGCQCLWELTEVKLPSPNTHTHTHTHDQRHM